MNEEKCVIEKIHTIDCSQRKVRVVRFNIDGKYALTAGSDKTVKLWNPYKSLHLSTYSGDYGEILDARSSSDNSMILSGGVSKNLLLHDVETKKNITRWLGHLAQINSVAFNDEGTIPFSASQDGTVRCYDLRNRSKNPIQIFDEATDAVLCISIKNHEIATGSADGQLRLYDLRKGIMTSDDCGHPVSSISFTSNNQCILVSILNSSVLLLDKVNGGSLLRFESHRNIEYKLESCIMASENEIVSCSEDGYLYVYNMLNGNLLGKCDHKPNLYIHSVVSHPKESKMLSATADKISTTQYINSSDSVYIHKGTYKAFQEIYKVYFTMATSSDIFVNLAEENCTYKINDNSTNMNIGNDYFQATDILALSNISENPNYSENNISTLSSPFLSISSTIFSKEQFNTDYDILTSITAEKLHSLIIQGDKVLSDNFLRLFMQSPPLTEYLSRILIRNTEIAMERLRLMQLTNELNLSNYSSGLSTPLPPQTIFEPSQCNSPSTEIAPSVTSDTSSEISLYEEAVNEVLMESTTQLTQHEYEAILGMLQLKNSCN